MVLAYYVGCIYSPADRIWKFPEYHRKNGNIFEHPVFYLPQDDYLARYQGCSFGCSNLLKDTDHVRDRHFDSFGWEMGNLILPLPNSSPLYLGCWEQS